MSNATAVKERKSNKPKEKTIPTVGQSGLPEPQIRILKLLAKQNGHGIGVTQIYRETGVTQGYGWIDDFKNSSHKTKLPSLMELKLIKYVLPDDDNQANRTMYGITSKGLKALEKANQ